LNSVVTQTQPAITHRERGLARLILGAATAGALWFVLCRHLSGEWAINEQYNYGWFVPFFCALPLLAALGKSAASAATFKKRVVRDGPRVHKRGNAMTDAIDFT